jgi:hypothetical protein
VRFTATVNPSVAGRRVVSWPISRDPPVTLVTRVVVEALDCSLMMV